MYARKYYLIIYRRSLLPEYSRTSQQQYSPPFTIHFFTFTFSPFSLLFLSLSPPISPTVHSSQPHNIRDKD